MECRTHGTFLAIAINPNNVTKDQKRMYFNKVWPAEKRV